MGSARAARRIQPGGRVGPAGAIGSLDRGPSVGRELGLRRAHFLRGGAPRPAPVWPGRVRGRRWLGFAPRGARALQRPPAPTLPLSPGAAGSVLRAFPLPRGTGPPAPDACVARTGLSPVRIRKRRAARAGTGPRKTGARGPRRCRPPTRPVLKHGPRSLTRARVRGCPRAPTAQ